MSKFRLAVSCPICNDLIIHDGFVYDLTTPDEGIQIVNLALFSNEVFTCETCGTEVYTGDEECMYEYEQTEDCISTEVDLDFENDDE